MPVFAKWIKKITSIFAEKTPVKPDDFELEHFLIYHGLVGTTPENQRQFKDVRADLKMAIDAQSKHQVASMLKLPPMWWEDRLKTIFNEFTDRELVISLLAPDINEEALTHEDNALLHEDWQVRANAALLLAHLNATEVIDKIIHSLHDTAGSARNAFPHTANALGRLRVQSGAAALAKYGDDGDAWIQVDVAAALALMHDDTPSPELIKVLLNNHDLSDYTAVGVSRALKPVTFFQTADEHSIVAGCHIINGLLDAVHGPFTEDVVADLGAPECFPALAKLLEEKPTCTIAVTATRLADWLDSHHSYVIMSPPSQGEVDKVLAFAKSDECSTLVHNTLRSLSEGSDAENPLQHRELRSAILLAAKLGDANFAPIIEKILHAEHPLLDDSIQTLSRLGAESAAAKLIEIAAVKVDLEDRWQQPKQLNPVQEPNRADAKTYWLILKALASMPTKQSAEFLLKATEDHAPDKRAQAIDSIVAVADELDEAAKKDLLAPLQTRLGAALLDPSADVRKAALRGVATFEIVSDLDKVVAMTRAREVSTQREAFDTLSELAKKGHKSRVLETVGQALKSEPNVHKRQKLQDFLDDTSR